MQESFDLLVVKIDDTFLSKDGPETTFESLQSLDGLVSTDIALAFGFGTVPKIALPAQSMNIPGMGIQIDDSKLDTCNDCLASVDISWLRDRCGGGNQLMLDALIIFANQGQHHLTAISTAFRNYDVESLLFHAVFCLGFLLCFHP